MNNKFIIAFILLAIQSSQAVASTLSCTSGAFFPGGHQFIFSEFNFPSMTQSGSTFRLDMYDDAGNAIPLTEWGLGLATATAVCYGSAADHTCYHDPEISSAGTSLYISFSTSDGAAEDIGNGAMVDIEWPAMMITSSVRLVMTSASTGVSIQSTYSANTSVTTASWELPDSIFLPDTSPGEQVHGDSLPAPEGGLGSLVLTSAENTAVQLELGGVTEPDMITIPDGEITSIIVKAMDTAEAGGYRRIYNATLLCP